jgi:LysR family transcriptional regulator, glycine cleavage system transcriptional activator
VSRLPPLNALRAFEAAARHLSFKQAAAELCVTPGAISRHVGNLEDDLGTSLFIRRNRSIRLTRHGESYLGDVRGAFERMDRATAALRSTLIDEKSLRLKLPPTCAMRWLVPRLAGFHTQHPDISVQISTSHEPVDFDHDEVDLAIQYGTGIGPGLAGERLFDEVLMPVCRPGLIEDPAPVAPGALAENVLLHSFRRPHDWPRWFEAAGIPDRQIAREIVFENSSLTCQGAIDGLGVAIAQAAFVQDEIKSGRLVCPTDLPLRTDYGYYLVCPKGKTRQKKVRLFQSWIATEAQGRSAERPHVPSR